MAVQMHPTHASTWMSAAAARLCAFVILVLVTWWVAALLGGVSASPEAAAADGSVKTVRLFNWHPVLMTLAFPILMSEALLAYRSPLCAGTPRPTRKIMHWLCHSGAVICMAAGLSAVWRSHDLAVPRMANLYSPHSFLGMAAVCLLGVQFLVGFVSYLWPKTSEEHRQSLGPIHRFLGQATYCAGLAAVAAGLQEKATFLQAYNSKPVSSAHIRAPAWAAALLLPLALLVLYPQVPPPQRQQAALQQHVRSSLDAEEAVPLAAAR